jgi:flagellar protein FliO/FliZ
MIVLSCAVVSHSYAEPEKSSSPEKTLVSDSIELKKKSKLPKSLSKPVSFGDMFQVFWGLIVVIVAIIVMLWLLKRLGGVATAGNKQIRILGGISLGAREKLVVVQVGDEQLVLGVAPGSVQTLHTLKEPLQIDSTTEPFNQVFAKKLQGLLKGKKND